MIQDAYIICPEHGDLVMQEDVEYSRTTVDATQMQVCQDWVPQPVNGERIICVKCGREVEWWGGVVPVKGYNILPDDYDGIYAELRPRVKVIK